MFNGKYISISNVLEEVYGDLRLQEELNVSDVIRWTARALGLIGVPVMHVRKITGESIDNPTLKVENHRATIPCDVKDIITMRTYYVNDSHIITSFETGEIEMVYDAYPIDSKGFPMIPDDARTKEAFISYIEYMLFKRKWINGEIDERKFRHFESEWLFNAGSAATSLRTPSVDEMQKIANSWVSLVPRMEEHYNAFKYTYEPERRRQW